MRYTSRNRGPALAPEERDAKAALRAYVVTGDATEWTPTATLYGVYRRWHAEQDQRCRNDPERPDRLTPRQFGAALRRVFPLACRVRRRVAKRLLWGYAGLSGPLTIRSAWAGQRQPMRYRHGWKPFEPEGQGRGGAGYDPSVWVPSTEGVPLVVSQCSRFKV